MHIHILGGESALPAPFGSVTYPEVIWNAAVVVVAEVYMYERDGQVEIHSKHTVVIPF